VRRRSSATPYGKLRFDVCSILGILEIKTDPAVLRTRALEQSKRQRHRGPDWTGVFASERAILAHERLAIVDPMGGAQPLLGRNDAVVLAVNGEIYNHRELRDRYPDYPFKTGSDCEVILALYEDKGADFLEELSGIFAFVLYDTVRDRYVIARDPIGVMPLYTGRDEHGNLYVASEMKALVPECQVLEEFPPGHVLDSEVGQPRRYYAPSWRDYEAVRGTPVDLEALRVSLEDAVRRQLMCDVPYGVLLSGGLDSSLTSALAQRHARRRIEDDERSEAWFPRLHSFAIGLPGSPDLAKARVAADALGTVHHEFVYTFQEGLDALGDVIYHIETFDVTTIRASTPMYLLARRIKAMGIKMVFTGEGSDEIFGGYLYFHKAPNATEFHAETVRKLEQLHKFDCLRANKSLAAWGVEGRVPFLDREFLDVAMGFDAADKMCSDSKMEKYVLRRAFEGFLPEEILWRQKEQFSDGVGYGWIDGLKAHADTMVSDDELAHARDRFPRNPPATKEAYLYRTIFESHFPGDAAAAMVPEGKSIACSSPVALAWEQSFAELADPSGRAIRGVHRDSY
jgi:asparagine synthase (glutamine-hydrolysing)